MEQMTIGMIAEYTKANLSPDLKADQIVTHISNDSRTQGKDWVYLALIGERLDGHDFVAQALENGAVAAIVQKDCGPKSLIVKDSYRALKDIAMHYKERFPIPYVAVTGSSGKTTTKDMIYYALSASKRTLRSIGNLNSEIGLPMTILNLQAEHECAVVEMGMYNLGEVDYLAEIVKPHIGVITNVGIAHLMNLKTRENILKAKLEIANYMNTSDMLLINGDNDMLQTVRQDQVLPKLYTFGLTQNNDIYPIAQTSENNKTQVDAMVLGERISFEIPTIGAHNVSNALSALGVCKLLGHDLQAAARALAGYAPSRYRMEKSEVGEKLVINDCYNANPDSMRASISTLNYVEAKRKVSIVADMLELGEASWSFHREIGALLAETVDVVVAIGKDARAYIEGAKQKGMSEEQLHYFENNPQAIQEINAILKDGDAVLVKGSRGMRLEEVADAIRA